jgi:hypothetical protein
MNRADRLLAVLSSAPRPFSRAEIFERAGFMLTNNAASELRARGLVVEQSCESINGVTVYSYELAGPLSEADEQPAAGPHPIASGRKQSRSDHGPGAAASSVSESGQLAFEVAA